MLLKTNNVIGDLIKAVQPKIQILGIVDRNRNTEFLLLDTRQGTQVLLVLLLETIDFRILCQVINLTHFNRMVPDQSIFLHHKTINTQDLIQVGEGNLHTKVGHLGRTMADIKVNRNRSFLL